MENVIFRLAVSSDFPQIWQIIVQAKAQMKRLGSTQWGEDYPTEDIIQSDISSRNAYVLSCGSDVIAYGVIGLSGERAYDSIDGAWAVDTDRYVVLHRLAVADKYKKQGFAGMFFDNVEQLAAKKGYKSFRVDTNFDNAYMLRLIENKGFVYCGKVHYVRGERLAYEKSV